MDSQKLMNSFEMKKRIDHLIIFETVIFFGNLLTFQISLYREGLKSLSYSTFGWDCIRKASLSFIT